MTAPLDLSACTGCGFTVAGITVGCTACATRHPDRYAKMCADQATELDELRQVLIAAEHWFLSIDATRTPQESALALALRARNPHLGVRRGIVITHQPKETT